MHVAKLSGALRTRKRVRAVCGWALDVRRTALWALTEMLIRLHREEARVLGNELRRSSEQAAQQRLIDQGAASVIIVAEDAVWAAEPDHLCLGDLVRHVLEDAILGLEIGWEFGTYAS